MGSSYSKVGSPITQLHDQTNERKEDLDQTVVEFEKQLKEERPKRDDETAIMDKGAAFISCIINLNVGGEKMSTLRTTLTLIDGSLLATMFSGKCEDKLRKDPDGCIFLDYDPALFKHLLNQLRIWSYSPEERVFHSPVGSEQLFLQFVRSLKFDERLIDGGKSVITSADKVMQPKEEVKPSSNNETTTTIVTMVGQLEEEVKPSADDGTATTNASTLEQLEEETKPSADDGTTTTNVTTVGQIEEEVKPAADDGTTTANATTVGQPEEEVKPSADDGTTNAINTTTVGQSNEEVECFRITNSSGVQLSDNDRRCEKIGQTNDWQCVFGTLNYSAGIHRIRLRIEQGSIDILLGICSRDKPPTGPYLFDKPTTHGWFTHGYAVTNGQTPQPGWSQAHENDILELTINCDERSLSILNETGQKNGTMQVDINQAPFPWCLLVLLRYKGGRVSLV